MNFIATILIIGILIICVKLIHKVVVWDNSKSDNSKSDKPKTSLELLVEISDIINDTIDVPISGLNTQELYMRDYIMNKSFSDLCSHPRYNSRNSIIAYQEVHKRVKEYYDQISPEGKIIKRNELIEEILK